MTRTPSAGWLLTPSNHPAGFHLLSTVWPDRIARLSCLAVGLVSMSDAWCSAMLNLGVQPDACAADQTILCTGALTHG